MESNQRPSVGRTGTRPLIHMTVLFYCNISCTAVPLLSRRGGVDGGPLPPPQPGRLVTAKCLRVIGRGKKKRKHTGAQIVPRNTHTDVCLSSCRSSPDIYFHVCVSLKMCVRV